MVQALFAFGIVAGYPLLFPTRDRTTVLYLATGGPVIALITMVSWKAIPYFVKQIPGLVSQIQTLAIRQFEESDARWNLTSYVDPDQVRDSIVQGTAGGLSVVARWLKSLYKGVFYVIIALAVNLVFYMRTDKIDAVFHRRPGSLMGFLYRFAIRRVRTFYFYFKRVMGGQLVIAAVNTALSSALIFSLGLPHKITLIMLVFFSGLFPIVGNLVSNTVLAITALVAVGPWAAFVCLIFLIGIHKLEYILNSKIIGGIVDVPMVVILISLVVSEVLLGIVGLMLAIPLLLFARHELEGIPGLAAVATTDRVGTAAERP